MALELTQNAQDLSAQTNIEQQVIVTFENIPFVFSTIGVSRVARYGDDIKYGDTGLVYGGVIEEPDGRAYISLNGTTNNIKQQIEIDRGGSSSITNFKVRMIDKDGLMVDLFTPKNEYNVDPLGITARVFLNFSGGAHPEDSTLFLIGRVADIDHGAGYVDITIASPQAKKRAKAFTKVDAQLTANISDTDTTIPVNNTANFLSPKDALRSYIKINDEIIEVGARTATSFTVITRGALNTIADSHDNEDDVESFYRLEDSSLDLALKIMLSNSDNSPYFTDETVLAIRQLNAAININGAILFDSENISTDYGLVVGDTITLKNSLNPSNDGTYTILSFGELPTGVQYAVTDGDFLAEVQSGALMDLNSQFNTLPDGLNMTPLEVDVQRHIDLKTRFPSDVVNMDFYLDDEIQGTTFIDENIYFPTGFYSVPRAGMKASVNITTPPIATEELPLLDASNIISPDKIKIKRSTNKYYYNSVVYKYERDSLEGNLLARSINISATSLSRILNENKPLEIEATGLRRSTDTSEFINRKSTRYLDVYQLGAEVIDMQVLYKAGFKIEVADNVLLDGSGVKLVDSRLRSRDFAPRVMLVKNKSINLKTGKVEVSLIDTGISTQGRYAVIGPSSKIASGSTTTTLKLKEGLQIPLGSDETFKWVDYLGENILIRSSDYSYTDSGVLESIDQGAPNTLIVSGLSAAPIEDYIIDMPAYPDNTNADNNASWKNVHAFLSPQVLVTNGISDTQIEVDSSDIDKFFIGSIVRVHSPDYINDSLVEIVDQEPVVSDITGNVLTLDKSLGYTPAINDEIDLIGFKDEGFPYRLI